MILLPSEYGEHFLYNYKKTIPKVIVWLRLEILQEINSNDIKVDEVKKIHKKLVSQFEEIQISYDVDTQLLMGDINNDWINLSIL